jgi:hypothetical protein
VEQDENIEVEKLLLLQIVRPKLKEVPIPPIAVQVDCKAI